eukprot:NODE_2559_length_1169_cov_31.308036_g2339_i0.p1 GENE.NODE_2559_length_1169_cov_31.308036_g2339_i0~~NODE_2559_length_1169_cov_31.308036_g2339_i0.p1  ORF type:complete len:274 (+),score=33.32 NODE_2559_length_1169_cov_31.308036_g2339_i0:82-903(+)
MTGILDASMIHNNLLGLEGQLSFVSPSLYRQLQTVIRPHHRAELIDWLLGIALECGIRSSVLFLAVNCLDRMLCTQYIPLARFQLVGVTCLFIAAKYETTPNHSPIAVATLADYTDNAFTKEQILNMELSILTALRFKISAPTTVEFLLLYLSEMGESMSSQLSRLAECVTVLTLTDVSSMAYLPSVTAAAAIVVALSELKRPPWPSTLASLLPNSIEHLNGCLQSIHRVMERAQTSPLESVQDIIASDRMFQEALSTLSGAIQLDSTGKQVV